MAKLTFKYTDSDFESREASEIEFSIPDDLDIYEYKTVCMRLAAALGYHADTIKKGFGDSVDDVKNKNGLKQLLNEISKKD